MRLTVSHVTKTFPGDTGPATVLDDVSLQVAAGEAVALTGESGSGKSTLLHVVAGLEPADSGSVHVDDAELLSKDDAGRAEIRRTRLGIVFQQFNLVPSLNVSQNIAFQARLAGKHDPTAQDTLIDKLGLTPHARKFPEELSGGQQQRVAIGRALAPGPALLLADEPTGNLDEATGDAVIDLMLTLARDAGAALLMVTHSDRLATRADRRLHLSRGRLT
ncbi:MAG: ABC transporter ATP-binding protein [Pseudomonadota bacterium]